MKEKVKRQLLDVKFLISEDRRARLLNLIVQNRLSDEELKNLAIMLAKVLVSEKNMAEEYLRKEFDFLNGLKKIFDKYSKKVISVARGRLEKYYTDRDVERVEAEISEL